MTARYIVGDTRAVLATLEPGSVDLVLTSPPFLALRSYLPADHPDKPNEIGSEPTPGAYIDTLLDVVEACARVLAPHGSMCFELGDTYAGSGGADGDYNENGLRDGQPKFRQNNPYTSGYSGYSHGRDTKKIPGQIPLNAGPGWPLDRSLCLIPEIFRFALVYGFNPLTGRQAPRWRARNVIRWCRPNPPVGALGDKFRAATTDMVVVCKNRRYFDLDAVRRPLADSPGNRYTRKVSAGDLDGRASATNGIDRETNKITADYDPAESAGAPPLDWWKIATQPYEGAHYATWPEQLCVIPVKSMCPQRVCVECGAPSERIVRLDGYERTDSKRVPPRLAMTTGTRAAYDHLVNEWIQENGANTSVNRVAETVGWTDCGHDAWAPGVVLDPFAGSGTTLQVATGHGRHAIGIDLDARNAQLALDRVGPLMLTVEHHDREPQQTDGPDYHTDHAAWELRAGQ